MKKTTDEVRQKIREDREQHGMTLYQLAEKYGMPKSTVFLMIRGCDASRVERASPNRKVVQRVQAKIRPEISKTDLGEAARQMICARLMLNGVKVFRPMTEDTPIDLLVWCRDGRMLKCQCKYLYPDKRGAHVLMCHSAGRGKNRGISKHIYTEHEIDFFLGYCWDNDEVYVVPRSVTDGRQECRFWILRSPAGGCVGRRMDEEKYKGAFDLLI